MRARHRSIDVFTKQSIFVSPKSKRTRKSSFLRFGFLLRVCLFCFFSFFFTNDRDERVFKGEELSLTRFGGVLRLRLRGKFDTLGFRTLMGVRHRQRESRHFKAHDLFS